MRAKLAMLAAAAAIGTALALAAPALQDGDGLNGVDGIGGNRGGVNAIQGVDGR